MNYLDKVSEFHSTFDHPILNDPKIPCDDRCKLRISLLQEELNELVKSIRDKNIVEAADAFCDLQYVLSGAILEFGLKEKFDELFNEVHRSNMSKACNTKEEAELTIDDYYKQDGTIGYFKESMGKFLVFRKNDNKTLKSINYSKVNLKFILNKK